MEEWSDYVSMEDLNHNLETASTQTFYLRPSLFLRMITTCCGEWSMGEDCPYCGESINFE